MPPRNPSAASGLKVAVRGTDDEIYQIIERLLTNSLSKEACVSDLTTLEAATLRNAVCHKSILSFGGAKAITTVMAEHIDDASIQTLACRILQHIAAADHIECAAQLASDGAIAAMRFAMGAHPNDALVQQVACHALELLAFASPDAKAQAVTDGAVEAVLGVLRTHRKNEHVVLGALAALQALVEDEPDSQQRLQRESGAPSIVAAMAEHRDLPQTIAWGRLLLQGLCLAGDPELRAEVLRKCHYQGIDLELAI